MIAADAQNDAAKAALAKLDGTWTPTSLLYNGKDITAKYKFKFVFKDGPGQRRRQ